MNSELLKEMKQILGKEGPRRGNLPIPNYLFVQQYGREIKEDMPQIAELFGYNKWFFFDSRIHQQEGDLLSRFKMELSRHAGLGREYEGSILVELLLPENEREEKELSKLLSYIDTQKNRFHCVYTLQGEASGSEMKRYLEKYGFVRAIHAVAYTAMEQVDIFVRVLEDYQFQVDEVAKQWVEDFFTDKEWEPSDMVEVRIENLAKEIVYRSLIHEETQNYIVHKEDVETVFETLAKVGGKKRQIGFVIGGMSA